GGLFKKDEVLLKINPEDHLINIELQKSFLTKAEADLELEMGQQKLSSYELKKYKEIGQKISSESLNLILRKPQLKSAKATIAAAKANLSKARLDLSRTQITAPFAGVILERNVELGSKVNPGSIVCSLLGIEEYLLEALVSVDKLSWINIPGFNAQNGSKVQIFVPGRNGTERVIREGQIKSLLSGLEPGGRMARVLITILDPLQRSAPIAKRYPILLQQFVKIKIAGRFLENVYSIPRGAVRDGETIWIMKYNYTLKIEKINPVFKERDKVFVRMAPEYGELLITSDLGSIIPGMALRKAKKKAEQNKQETSQ
ncbi:efflux RND transporter periplasmic adaptor subunit, partial [Candidatus Riflebacteria bacterium]